MRRLSYTILILTAILGMIPFVWVIYASFMPTPDINAGLLWPRGGAGAFSWDNYHRVFAKMEGFGTYYLNSIILATFGTFLTLLVGSMAGFAFAKFHFPGKKALFLMFILTIMIPGEVTLMGVFHMLLKLKLYDTLTALLAGYTAANLVLTLFIMRNVFMTVPNDLIDAARIDGASVWQIFWQVMIPVGANGLAAAAVLVFLNIWNEYIFALTMTVSDHARTLPVAIPLLQLQWQLKDTGALFATVMLSFLPVTVAFVFLQKYFVRGLTAGAVKG
jgi:ABC-type glycerol-3-phosphate transport system permease component